MIRCFTLCRAVDCLGVVERSWLKIRPARPEWGTKGRSRRCWTFVGHTVGERRCCPMSLENAARWFLMWIPASPTNSNLATVWQAARQAGPKCSKKRRQYTQPDKLPNFWTSSTLSQKTCFFITRIVKERVLQRNTRLFGLQQKALEFCSHLNERFYSGAFYIKLPNQTDCTDCSPNHLNEIILLLC